MTPLQERQLNLAYGQTLSLLLSKGFPLSIAEDAVSKAVESAIGSWPKNPPDNPVAWLNTVALRSAIDERRRTKKLTTMDSQYDELLASLMADPESVPDERLRLFLICSHPAIEPSIQTPLMLQLVLGFNAQNIANLYAVPPATISQRIVRAKKKIQASNLTSLNPNVEDVPQRIDSILQAIYALYILGYEKPLEQEFNAMANEATELAEILHKLLPQIPEINGLLALILFCESRRKARRDANGKFVPFFQQDQSLWNKNLINRAEQLLFQASEQKRFGKFQLEAAIQSAHINRLSTGLPTPQTILQLYDALVAIAPTLGNQVSRIALKSQFAPPENCLKELEALNPSPQFQPYWVLKSHLLFRLRQTEAAIYASQVAQSLTQDPAVADHLSINTD